MATNLVVGGLVDGLAGSVFGFDSKNWFGPEFHQALRDGRFSYMAAGTAAEGVGFVYNVWRLGSTLSLLGYPTKMRLNPLNFGLKWETSAYKVKWLDNGDYIIKPLEIRLESHTWEVIRWLGKDPETKSWNLPRFQFYDHTHFHWHEYPKW